MQRRRLLQVGLAGTAVLALGGLGAALWRPGLEGNRLAASGRLVLSAVARALLDGSLPEDPAAQSTALQALLTRIDGAIAALPPATRAELSQLLGLMTTPPGRRWFVGLEAPWEQASTAQIDAALQRLRHHDTDLAQQAYHALRELVHASYFSDPSTWPALGYPGPQAV